MLEKVKIVRTGPDSPSASSAFSVMIYNWYGGQLAHPCETKNSIMDIEDFLRNTN
jgi:hypothetical protein